MNFITAECSHSFNFHSVSDDNSVVPTNPETMEKLQIFCHDTILIKRCIIYSHDILKIQGRNIDCSMPLKLFTVLQRRQSGP
ncbi:hypothetical protein MKX01_012135 [Papaver californicum]|nr:hypothetical protein MKX01_012135 [Papaver californicum]